VLDEATAKLGAAARGIQADATSKSDMQHVAERLKPNTGSSTFFLLTPAAVTLRRSNS
jgi:hypothetical protein